MEKWFVTLGGIGYLPASGTFASFATCLALWPMLILTQSSLAGQTAVLVIGLLVFSWLNVMLGPWLVAFFGKKDPGECVLDEAAGICLTLLFLPGLGGTSLLIRLVAGFVAFRIFDITKPPPARQLEHLPLGWGILLDDLMAAVYANLLCQVVLRLM